jgi:hypothetical protein
VLLQAERTHAATAAIAADALLLLDLLQLLQAACAPGPCHHTACLAALAAAMRCCCCCCGCKPDMLVVKPLVEALLQDCMRLSQCLVAQRTRCGVCSSGKATLACAPAAGTAATRCSPRPMLTQLQLLLLQVKRGQTLTSPVDVRRCGGAAALQRACGMPWAADC